MPEFDMKDVEPFIAEIGAMPPASEIIAAGENSKPNEQPNFDPELVAEFKPSNPAGPAPTTPSPV